MNETRVPVKKVYTAPVLTKHQRLQKVTLGTVTPQFSDDSWLQAGTK